LALFIDTFAQVSRASYRVFYLRLRRFRRAKRALHFLEG
jgi:hypothetical protein